MPYADSERRAEYNKAYQLHRRDTAQKAGTCWVCNRTKENPRLRRCETCRIRELHAKTMDKDLRRYGLTQFAKAAIFRAQHGLCALCDRLLTADITVDHDHATGRVRGLTHRGCNTFLGFIEHNPGLLTRVPVYLKGAA